MDRRSDLFRRITLGRVAEDRLSLGAMIVGAALGDLVSVFRTASAVVLAVGRLEIHPIPDPGPILVFVFLVRPALIRRPGR